MIKLILLAVILTISMTCNARELTDEEFKYFEATHINYTIKIGPNGKAIIMNPGTEVYIDTTKQKYWTI